MNPYHYIVDGYNMLFRLMHSAQEDLQAGREFIISDLNKKISLLKLDVAIVFDAHFQMGESTRSHFDQLEVLFTAEGETADEYILERIVESATPEKMMVVTSDKPLALRVRHLSGNAQTVEEFLESLNRAFKNKCQEKKKREKKPPSLSLKGKKPPSTQPHEKKRGLPDRNLSAAQCEEFYEQVFLERLSKLEAIESQKKNEKREKKRCSPPRKSKKQAPPFSSDELVELDDPRQMERWLKIFESRS